MESVTRTRGVCRLCRRTVPLDRDGRIGAHPLPARIPADSSVFAGALAPDCGGVGYLPAADPADA